MTRAARTRRGRLLAVLIAPLAIWVSPDSYAQPAGPSSGSQQQKSSGEEPVGQHPYTGMWITDDGRVRHQLLPNGRYDEARGNRESAYRGRYEIKGSHIEYRDDTGFTASGDFTDAQTLHHGGMILRRR